MAKLDAEKVSPKEPDWKKQTNEKKGLKWGREQQKNSKASDGHGKKLKPTKRERQI